jgi:hypothetical protein
MWRTTYSPDDATITLHLIEETERTFCSGLRGGSPAMKRETMAQKPLYTTVTVKQNSEFCKNSVI